MPPQQAGLVGIPQFWRNAHKGRGVELHLHGKISGARSPMAGEQSLGEMVHGGFKMIVCTVPRNGPSSLGSIRSVLCVTVGTSASPRPGPKGSACALICSPLCSATGYNHNQPRRRVGRVAEGGGLLNRYRTKSSIGGSNPPLSARPYLDPATPGEIPSKTINSSTGTSQQGFCSPSPGSSTLLSMAAQLFGERSREGTTLCDAHRRREPPRSWLPAPHTVRVAYSHCSTAAAMAAPRRTIFTARRRRRFNAVSDNLLPSLVRMLCWTFKSGIRFMPDQSLVICASSAKEFLRSGRFPSAFLHKVSRGSRVRLALRRSPIAA